MSDKLVLREEREKCHKARDQYYECVDLLGEAASQPGAEVPSQCRAARTGFEQACRASWVKHFDSLRDKRLRYLQTIQRNIRAQEATALGSIAGQEQQ